MKTVEELRPERCDRSKWRPGVWDSEPDYRQWMDEKTGLPCLIVRNHYGNLCGYVGVSKGHPWFEVGYSEPDVSVHGGLTYADHCNDGICHTVEAGEDDNVWWLGFDTAHCDDASPQSDDISCRYGGVYRDFRYVTEQCRRLAEQCAQPHGLLQRNSDY